MHMTEVVDSVAAASGAVSDEKVEEYADAIVKHLSGSDLTYGQAYNTLNALRKIFAEAKYHLGHNAALELEGNPIQFVLDK